MFLSLLATLLVAACQAASPDKCRVVHVTDLNLTYSHRHIFTPGTLNDVAANLMIDTGSSSTLITKATADRLGLPIQFTTARLGGIGGSRSLYTFYAKSFRLGVLHGEHLPLNVSPIELAGFDPPADGIIGSDFLSHYDIDFDLPVHRARLFREIAGCASPVAVLDPPLYEADFVEPRPGRIDPRPHVKVEVGGKTFFAVVDSGADHTTIFRNAARRIGLRIGDLAEDMHFKDRGVGPHERAGVRHVMTPITIGDITISNLPVGIVDDSMEDGTDMLLGADFLAHVHVWLSFSSRTMIMQYPPKPSPSLPQ
jgi:predicted aspartyl protease